ncbi:MAG: T9SS type A sorting domain-containing protein [Ignavibacteria bacterium]|nr:T9SS type A sorting domain-containing protein [Ignavibacteria bacterium]
MRHLLAFILALLLASLCAAALRAQGVTTIPFPLPGHFFGATLTGEQNGVLVHGVADTVIATSQPGAGLSRKDISFPYVFTCDGNGIGELHCIPDTAVNNSFDLGSSSVETRTAALRDGPGRIMVAWSAQRFSFGCVSTSVEEAVLSLGVFENNAFRLLGRWPGSSHPQLLRGADGTVHFIFVRQKLLDQIGLQYSEYSGEIQAASYRGDALITPPVTVSRGVMPSAVLDAAGRVHIMSMEYDSIPAPVARLQYATGSGASWQPARTLAALPSAGRDPYRPSAPRLPSIVAFAADVRGVARVVLQAHDWWGSLLAFSSGGGNIALDSATGRWIGGVSCEIDSTGAVSCASTVSTSFQDTLYMRHVDPAMTTQRLERLAIDSTYNGGIVLQQTKGDGLCLLSARASSLWLFGKLEAGPRGPQQLAVDRVGYLLQDSPTACDSTGALWLAYQQSWASGQPTGTLLLRIPPGTVPVARVDAPAAFELHCFPSPATTDATIRFSLPTEQTVTITVHDMLGREVSRVADGERFAPGVHSRSLRLEGLPRGAYGVRLRASDAAAATTLLVR